MTTTWFTSDLHLGHQKVSEVRGFDNTDDHDLTVLSRIARTLSKRDNLWILGDLSAGGPVPQRRALEMIDGLADQLDINVHLVSGNHDTVHPLHRNSHKWIAAYDEVFDSVQPFARRKLAGRNLWLSHFPWRGGGDHTAVERFDTVRLNDDGVSWLLHGHTHSNQRVDRARRMIQVGVDAWDFEPVSIHTIEDIVREEDVPQVVSQGNGQEGEADMPIWKPKPRLNSCIEQWSNCSEGEYNPSCCRFPKSCSCTIYSDDIDPAHLEYPLPYEHTLAAWLERQR